MSLTIALAGDTMLGRGVSEELQRVPPERLISERVARLTRSADLFVLNLECCISERGTRWDSPGKPFFFRAHPVAVQTLVHLGVSCVTLANNHALDFGEDALRDTFRHLRAAGIEWVGAGTDVARARAPVVLEARGFRLAVIGVTDHPEDFAASATQPGVAYADLRAGTPGWLLGSIGDVRADAVLVTPHWGPNMVESPVLHVRDTARELVGAGATLVAGHSAHVFHGVDGPVLYDLGDFLDDYATDPVLRNDLGLLFLVTLDRAGPTRIEAVPLKLDYSRTAPAEGADRAWIADRFRSACREFGTEVREERGRLIVGETSNSLCPPQDRRRTPRSADQRRGTR